MCSMGWRVLNCCMSYTDKNWPKITYHSLILTKVSHYINSSNYSSKWIYSLFCEAFTWIPKYLTVNKLTNNSPFCLQKFLDKNRLWNFPVTKERKNKILQLLDSILCSNEYTSNYSKNKIKSRQRNQHS